MPMAKKSFTMNQKTPITMIAGAKYVGNPPIMGKNWFILNGVVHFTLTEDKVPKGTHYYVMVY